MYVILITLHTLDVPVVSHANFHDISLYIVIQFSGEELFPVFCDDYYMHH